jgi:formylmethanofuran dehydrogenase subunit B
MTDSRVDHVTCLGCGCGCDDISVTVRDGRIVEITPPCPVSRPWFGDGVVPWEVRRSGNPADLKEALSEAAGLLARQPGRVLVYLGADLSSAAQRCAIQVADLLRATVDTATSETAATGLLAVQRRGRATATLGEIRNRADVVLFWATDPARRYPRFQSRYAPAPSGTQIANGRADRFVISVHVGSEKAPSDADASLMLEPSDEIAALSLMRAAVAGNWPGELKTSLQEAVALVRRLSGARYAVLIHDAEPSAEPRNPLRVEGLITLAQALNGPTRAALLSLRAGGNRVGAESVLTWQSGFPYAVDYSRGYPRYVPEQRGLDMLEKRFGAALVVGSAAFDDQTASALANVPTVVIGPRASQSVYSPAVAIDTGVAGIHEGGTGYRMDDVPLSLRPPLAATRSTVDVLEALQGAIRLKAGSV